MGIILFSQLLDCNCAGEYKCPKLKKLNETKEGLDVYKIGSIIQIFECPICGEIADFKQIKEMEKQERSKGVSGIEKLVREFNYICERNVTLDFDKLENIENTIRDYYINFDENSVYKYKCQNNHQFYIRLFESLSDLSKIKLYYPLSELNQKYLTAKWKNNEKVKKQLIIEREKDFKKQRLEYQIRREFDNYLLEIEREKYEEAMNNFENYDKMYHSNPINVFSRILIDYNIQYYPTRMKIKDYCEKYYGEYIFNQFFRTGEEEEYEKFLRNRVGSDYDD